MDELRAHQLARLQATVHAAYEHVPHYRKAFDDKGIGPGRPASLEDLRHFPFTAKADLRDNYPFGMFAVPREQVVRVHASSGTTGRPTVVGYTAEDIATWASLMARSIRAAGGRPGDIVHVAYGYGLFTGGLGRALRRGGAGLHRRAGLRRDDRAAGAAHRRLPAARDHGDAVVLPVRAGPDGGRRPGRCGLLAGDRDLRGRAVDRRDADRDRDSRSGCTRSTSTGCPR